MRSTARKPESSCWGLTTNAGDLRNKSSTVSVAAVGGPLDAGHQQAHDRLLLERVAEVTEAGVEGAAAARQVVDPGAGPLADAAGRHGRGGQQQRGEGGRLADGDAGRAALA